MSQALLQAWQATVRRRGLERAIVHAADGRGRTFAELDADARAWQAANIPSEDLSGRAVVFAIDNGIAWFEAFLGLLRAGAVLVPLDGAEPRGAQKRIAEQLRAGGWWDGGRLIRLESARHFRDPHVCLIKLTSGSTGAPRPLVFTAEQLLADARQVAGTMGIKSSDLNHALIPFGHSYGLGNLSLPLLTRGVPLVVGSSPLPHAIAADFARWRPTVFPSVPAVWRALAASDVTPAALDSLRLAISAGAPLAPQIARDFEARLGRRIHSFYGSSETGGIAYDRSGGATLAGSVGRPMRGVRVTLRRQRLLVSSPAVFTYGNRRRVGRDGAWTPGDRAEVDGRGNLKLLGRRGTIVKIAGRRVDLMEVVRRLQTLPGVREAWADAGSNADPMLGAVVATAEPVTQLRALLAADTPAWKIPKRWVTVPALPLTARGKLDVRGLRALLAGSASRA
jgi:long-chain acyl-CoA synthetase